MADGEAISLAAARALLVRALKEPVSEVEGREAIKEAKAVAEGAGGVLPASEMKRKTQPKSPLARARASCKLRAPADTPVHSSTCRVSITMSALTPMACARCFAGTFATRMRHLRFLRGQRWLW